MKGDFNMENEENAREEIVEVHLDCDMVAIPISRFEDLIAKENTLKIIQLIYNNSESYELQKHLAIVFEEKENK